MNNYHDRQAAATTTAALLIQPGSIVASAGRRVGEETWRAGAEQDEEVTGYRAEGGASANFASFSSQRG